MTKADWDSCVVASPQKSFHAWLARFHLKALDSWAWGCERVDSVHSKIFGCVRVQEREPVDRGPSLRLGRAIRAHLMWWNGPTKTTRRRPLSISRGCSQ